MRKQPNEDSEWTLLKSVKLDLEQKESLKERIEYSVSKSPYSKPIQHRWIEWKGILATCLLFIIGGGLIWQLTQGFQQAGEDTEESEFSWSLKGVYGQKSEEGFTIYRENKKVPVGFMREINEGERNTIIASSNMHVHEELEDFPYPTTMYIEHVKMEVALRYHFFIKQTGGMYIYFSFDYPQLEYAEIFEAIGTLRLRGQKPLEHSEPLYVNHGYGKMYFPVGIKPLNTDSNKEIYLWEEATEQIFAAYLSKLEELLPNWTKIGSAFTSPDGIETVQISLEGKELIYEFTYQNQEE